MRLIDADAFKNYIRSALDDVKHLYKDNGAWAQEITDSFCKDIDEQPTIEAEPVKRGRWEKHDNLMGEYYHCSVCDTRTEVATCMGDPIFVYCPYCGARMKSNEQEEKHEHRKESKRT